MPLFPLLPIFMLAAALSAAAQVTTATIYGTVTDPSGALTPGVSVKLTHQETGAVSSSTTGSRGEFTFTFLPVGTYSIRLQAQGFKERSEQGIELAAGQRVRLAYTLEIGQASESVTVTAEVPLVNAVNAEQRETFEGRQVTELPLNRRDWTNVLRVGAGVDTGGVSGNGGGISLNGLPPSGMAFTIDGTNASQAPEISSITMFEGFNFIKGVSLEAVGEVGVTKGITSAEFGNTLSGNINVQTKSGSNELHGSLFENYQTTNWNARNQFAAARTPVVFHQFGGSAGGPVVRNKLFFFGVFEGYRNTAAQLINTTVATQSLRTEAMAAVPAYKAYFDLMPLPNQPTAAGLAAGIFMGQGATKSNDNHVVSRGDYYLTSNSLFNARYTRSRPDRFAPRDFLSRSYKGQIDNATGIHTLIRPSWSAQTRFGFMTSNVDRLDEIYASGVPPVLLRDSRLGRFGAGGETFNTRGNRYSFEEIVALTRGRHSIKAGVLIEFANQTRENIEAPELTYSSVADLLANVPNTVRHTFGLREYLLNYWTNGYFFQDDFKVNSRLLLNLGVRYDYFSVPRERDRRLFNRDEPFGFGPLRDPDSMVYADRNNISPRVGFAYTLDRAGRTVIRGGAGAFHAPVVFAMAIPLVRNALDEPTRVDLSRAEAAALKIKYPSYDKDVLPLVKNPNFPWSGLHVDARMPTPYSLQWLLNLERQLTSTMAAEVGYVGTRGVKLVAYRRLNQVDRVSGQRPVAGFLEFYDYNPSDRSWYDALQISVRKRFARGLHFNAHYTYSKTTSFGNADFQASSPDLVPQDEWNYFLEKGPASYDIRSRFASDFAYELPFARLAAANGWTSRLLGGWQVAGIFTAQTGEPFHLNFSGRPGARADYLGGDPYLNDASRPLQYLDMSRFANPPVSASGNRPLRPGTLGRNALRRPGFWNIDTSLSKAVAVTERVRLSLRLDAFNAFNHTSMGAVRLGDVGTVGVGAFTSTRGARAVQISGRLTF